MQQPITILKNIKRGHSNFTFSVLCHSNRFKGTWFTVYINQVTDMKDLGEENFSCTHKIVCPTSMTEHAAINFAGKKLLKEWVNLN